MGEWWISTVRHALEYSSMLKGELVAGLKVLGLEK